MITLILCTFLIGILIGYYKQKFKYNYWQERNVKFAKPLPLFGCYLPAFLMRISSGKLLENLHREFENEPYTGFYIFNKPALMIRDPKIIKMILVKDFNCFHNRSTSGVNEKDLVGTFSLLTLKDSNWKIVRNKIVPFFSTKQMKQSFEFMNEVGQNFNKEIYKTIETQTNVLEMKDTAIEFTTDTIASCVFGVSGPTKFVDITKAIFSHSYVRCFEWNSFFFMPFFAALFKLSFLGYEPSNYLRKIFLKSLNKRKEQLQDNSIKKRYDFINFLIELQKKQENETNTVMLLDDKLLAQATVFFTAGVEGASTTISLGLYHLALNLDIQHKLKNEIKKVLTDNDDHLTYDNVNDMIYLDLCVREMLRFGIALPFIDRIAEQDYEVAGTDLIIEKGIGVFISLYGIHLDPKNFPNPYQFDPERFNKKNKSSIDPFSYLPFGAGPHNCVGYRFGVMQVKIGLIYLLKDFKVEVVKKLKEPFEAHPTAFFYRSVNGCNLRIIKDNDTVVGN